MHWTQYAYIALLTLGTLAALRVGRGGLAAVMWANFTATFLAAGNASLIATADIISAVLIIFLFADVAGLAVAVIFMFMVVVYMPTGVLFNKATTYTIVDILAIIQIIILGGRGYARNVRTIYMALVGSVRPASHALYVEQTQTPFTDATPSPDNHDSPRAGSTSKGDYQR
jgi:hypothetical protein